MRRAARLTLATAFSLQGALQGAGVALANPLEPSVRAGAVSIAESGPRLDIHQSTGKAIIDWRGFSIDNGETTQFHQPSSAAIALNRVTGGGPSNILGTLQANGQVMLVNPNGVFFGAGARVDVAGLVATTSDIRNEDFLNGNYSFSMPSPNPDAAVVNEGLITVAAAGYAALVAPAVRNSGVIDARLGRVTLGAGQVFALDLYGDGLVTFQVGVDAAPPDEDGGSNEALVRNDGQIFAGAGTVTLTAASLGAVTRNVVNMDGLIQANSFENRGGCVVLGVTGQGTTRVAGSIEAEAGAVEIAGRDVLVEPGATIAAARGMVRIAAANDVSLRDAVIGAARVAVAADADRSGKQGTGLTGGDAVLENATIDAAGPAGAKGGPVEITGDRIALRGSSMIDASGAQGGGEILIGGDFQGGGATRTARATAIGPQARLHADARTAGDGGRVIVWADETTRFHGRITATGGPHGGDGGFAEVSGKQYLDYRGFADLRAAMGAVGTLLLDPQNLTIQDGGVDTNIVGDPDFTTDGTSAILLTATIEAALAGSDVTITTSAAGGENGVITVSGDIDAPNTAFGLTMTAHHNIVVQNPIDMAANGGTGTLTLIADSDGNESGNINLSTAAAALTTNGAAISLQGANFFSAAGSSVTSNGGDITIANSAPARQINFDDTPGPNSFEISDATLDSLNAGAGRIIIGGADQAGDIVTSTAVTFGGTAGTLVLRTGGTFVLSNSFNSGASDLSILAGDVALGAAVTAAGGTVTIEPRGTDTVVLGSNPATADSVELNDAELDRITATTLVVGAAAGGAIGLTADISPANVTNLHLISGSTITGLDPAGGIAVPGLALTAGDTISFTDATTDIDNLAVSAAGQTVTFIDADGLDIGTVDGVSGLAAATFSLTTGGTITDSQAIVATELAVTNTAASTTLDAAANDVDALAIGAAGQVVTFVDTDGLVIDTVDGIVGVTAGAFSLTAGGAVSDNQAIVATDLAVTNTSAPTTLDEAANDVDTLAASASGQNFTFVDADDLVVGTVDGIVGITSRLASVTAAGDFTIDSAISGARGVTLTNSGPDATTFVNAAVRISTSSNRQIDVTADDLEIDTGSGSFGTNENQNVHTLNIRTLTPGQQINLAAANVPGNGVMELTNAELGRLNLGSQNLDDINIGDETGTGRITLSGSISNFSGIDRRLRNNADVVQTAATTIGRMQIDAATGIALNDAGNDITVQLAASSDAGDIAVVDANGLTLGAVTATTGNVSLTALAGDLIANAVTGGGTIVMAAGGDNSILQLNGAISGTAGAHSYTGDEIVIAGTIAATGQTVTLQSDTAGDALNLGAGADDADTLDISGAELQNVTAQNLVLGGAKQGAIAVDGVTAANSASIAGTVTLDALRDESTIAFSGAASTFNALAANADAGIDVNVDVTTDTGDLSFDADSDGANDTGDDSLTFGAGTITVSTAGALDLLATTGGIAALGAAVFNIDDGFTLGGDLTVAGATTFNADADNDGIGAFTVNDGFTLSSSDNPLAVIAADLDLGATGMLDAGAGTATLRSSNGRTIGLGDTAADFHVSRSEVNRITAGALVVGDSSNGSITVDGIQSADVDQIAGAVTLNATAAGAAVSFTNGASVFGNLVVNAEAGVTIGQDLTAGILTIDADSDDAGDDGNLIVATGATLATADAAIAVTANDIDLQGTGAIDSGTASTTLLVSDGGSIGLGATAGNYTLSGAELQNIAATGLTIGDATTGAITVDGITAANSNGIAGTLTLNATANDGDVTFANTASTFNALTVNADDAIFVNVDLTSDGGSLTLQADSDGAGDSDGDRISLASGVTLTTASGLTLTAPTGGIVALGPVTFSAADGLTLGDLTIAGTATLNADNDADGSGTYTQSGGTTFSTSDNLLTVIAGDIDLQGTITSGTAATVLQTTNGNSLGVADGAGTFQVAKAELARITASNLNLGGADTGAVTVDNLQEADLAGIAGGLTLTAGNAAAAATFSGTASTIGRALTVSAGNGIAVDTDLTAGGTTTLDADADDSGVGTFAVAGGQVLDSGHGALSVTAAEIDLAGSLDSGAGATTLLTSTAGPIDLGTDDGTAGELELTNADLQSITAAALTIGDGSAGAITVSADVTPGAAAGTGVTSLHLVTGATVTATAGGIVESNLAITAGGTVTVADTSTDVDILAVSAAGQSTAFADADGLAIGTVDGVTGIASAALALDAAGGVAVDESIAATGAVTIDADSDGDGTGDFTLAAARAVDAANNAVSVTANDMALTGTLSSGAARTSLLVSDGGSIDLGTASGGLNLSAAELDRVTAGVLQVGDATAGAIVVGADIAPAGTAVLHLVTGATVTATAGGIVESNLAITAGGTVTATDSSTDVDILAVSAAGQSTAFADADGLAVGTVDGVTGIASAALALDAAGGVAVDESIAATGAVTIDADSDGDGTGDFTLAAARTVDAANNAVSVTANDMALTGTLSSGAARTSLLVSDGGSIDLGTASGGLNLSAAELDRVTAGVLQVGDATAGAIVVGADIAPAGTAMLYLVTGATVTASAGGIVESNLAITAGGTVTFSDSSTDVDTLAVNAAGQSFAFADADGVDIGTVDDVAGVTATSLTLNTGGAMTDSAASTVTATTTLAAGAANDITLDTAGNDFATVAIASGRNVTLADVNALVLGASTVSGTLDVTTSGALTDSGALAVAGTTTLAAGAGNDITLDTSGNDFATLAIASGRNVTLTDVNGLALGASTVSGTLDVATGDALTDSGALAVAGTTTLAAGAANDITLDTAGNDFATLAIASGRNVTLTDVNGLALGASTVSGTLDVTTGGALTDNGTLAVAGTTTLAAGAANDITLDTAGNDFATLAIASGRNVTLTDVNGLALGASTVLGTLDVATGDALTDSGALAVAGTTTLAAGAANDITLDTAGNDFATLAIASGRNVTLTDVNGLALGASTVSGTLDVTTGGALTDSGALAVTGTTTLAAGAGNDITLDSAGNDFATLVIASGRNVTLADANALALGASTVSGSLDVAAASGVTLSGAVTTDGSTTIDSDSDGDGTGDFALGAALDTAGNTLRITANDIALASTIDSGAASVTLLVSDGGTIGLGATTGDMTLSGTELQGIAATGLTIGDMSNGTVTVDGITAAVSDSISGNLTLNSGADIVFDGGASTFNALAANANDGITMAVALTTDTGDLALDGDADNAANGADRIAFASGITLISAGALHLDGTTGGLAGNGPLTIDANGDVILGAALATLGDLAITADLDGSGAGSVTATGIDAGNNAVVIGGVAVDISTSLAAGTATIDGTSSGSGVAVAALTLTGPGADLSGTVNGVSGADAAALVDMPDAPEFEFNGCTKSGCIAPAPSDPPGSDPVVEGPIVEDPVVENSVVEDPVAEDPVIEDPVVGDPVVQDPVVEDPVTGDPGVADPGVETPVVDIPGAASPEIEAPGIEIPAAETQVPGDPGQGDLDFVFHIPSSEIDQARLRKTPAAIATYLGEDDAALPLPDAEAETEVEVEVEVNVEVETGAQQ